MGWVENGFCANCHGFLFFGVFIDNQLLKSEFLRKSCAGAQFFAGMTLAVGLFVCLNPTYLTVDKPAGKQGFNKLPLLLRYMFRLFLFRFRHFPTLLQVGSW
jgi:hypothetical protein